ncbi:MAG: outer membrane lipoprotein-sorting protein [Deltaproteobacteria bacterium]|nr:outer membrane lipoprotein-sorting protein [Deltaproteobacteria bacterium]
MKNIVFFAAFLLLVPNLYAKIDAKKILDEQKKMNEIKRAELLKRDGNQILKKSDDKVDVSGILLKFEMKVFRKKRLRKTYKMTLKTRGTEKSLLEFTHPPRNRGQKMLRDKDNIWLYRPKINKIIRVSGRSNAVGSDFSNTDILFVRLDRDYNARLLDVETYNGEDAYKLELLAKSEEVTYAKIIYWIRVKDYLPLQRDFYTISVHKLKTLKLSVKSKVFEGNPDTLTMTNVLERNKRSVLHYTYLKTGRVFADKIFRKNSLLRKR